MAPLEPNTVSRFEDRKHGINQDPQSASMPCFHPPSTHHPTPHRLPHSIHIIMFLHYPVKMAMAILYFQINPHQHPKLFRQTQVSCDFLAFRLFKCQLFLGYKLYLIIIDYSIYHIISYHIILYYIYYIKTPLFYLPRNLPTSPASPSPASSKSPAPRGPPAPLGSSPAAVAAEASRAPAGDAPAALGGRW